MSNAGTIADTGQYGVYLDDGTTKVGELDEEFIFETRVGDVFLLGSRVWRVLNIHDDRIIVGDASGLVPRMPFWNGDLPWRPYELGERIGRFRHTVAEKIQVLKANGDGQPALDELNAWLQHEYALDENSSQNLIAYVSGQLDAVGVISSDTTIVLEAFHDAVGEPRLVIHSPYGGRVNGAWAIALSDALRERLGVEVATEVNDDGILFHFPRTIGELPLDVIQQLTPSDARERILHELPGTEMFGAHFRMNAARALLLPRAHGTKRTPFWLQRLKAKGLLAMVRQFQDFPIVVETYRDCLRDVLDMPHLELILGRIQSGEIHVVPIETIVPSPVAAGLLQKFNKDFLYQWDAPQAERQLQALSLRRDLIEDILQGVELRDLLKPAAILDVAGRLQHTAVGYQARTMEELALFLLELGDLTSEEIHERVTDPNQADAWLGHLAEQKRIVQLSVTAGQGIESRWVLANQAAEYQPPMQLALLRMLRTHGPLTAQAILNRYAFDPGWLNETLLRQMTAREVVKGHFTHNSEQDEYVDKQVLEQIHRRTITLLRKEIQPVNLYAYSAFMSHWQHVHPLERLGGQDGMRQVLQQLRGLALPGMVWERDCLPIRLADYHPAELEALCQQGEVVWVGSGKDPRRGRLRFVLRGEGRLFLDEPTPHDIEAETLGEAARAVYEYLKSEGASFYSDIQAGLSLAPDAMQDALVELVMAGLATNDTLEALHAVFATRADEHLLEPDHPNQARSALESELAHRMIRRPIGSPPHTTSGRLMRPSRELMRQAQQRVNERVRGAGSTRLPQAPRRSTLASGRWSLVHRMAVLGPVQTADERAERTAQALLERYGIVTRECLEAEQVTVDWSALYQVLQRLEMRGEVRRGLFVAGLPGVQFAVPEAVEKLRSLSDMNDETMIVLNASDPANLFGGELSKGPQTVNGQPLTFARVPSTHVVLWQGKPVLVAEDNGERVTTLAGAGADILQRAMKAYVGRAGAQRRTLVSEWNGKAALGSAAQALLQPLGFSRTPSGLERWSD